MKKIYLAIPYTGIEESSFNQANAGMALILNKGHNVFSPISHGHTMSKNFNIPGTWEYWAKRDYQFIDWADEVWLLIPKESTNLELVLKSKGVMAELQYAADNKKILKFFRIIDGQIMFENHKG